MLRAGSVNARAGFVLDLAAGTVASNSATPHFTGTVRGIESVVGADAFADILRGSDAGESFAGAGGNGAVHGVGDGEHGAVNDPHAQPARTDLQLRLPEGAPIELGRYTLPDGATSVHAQLCLPTAPNARAARWCC